MAMVKSWRISGIKLLLFVFFLFTVILPLFRMFGEMATTNVGALLSSARFLSALKNSLWASLLSTILSVGVATLLAWCIVRTGIRFKGMWIVLFTIPMLIPSISHGMGLMVLLGSNGILTNLFPMDVKLYGLFGIIAGSFLYSFPVAFLMVLDILRYEDSGPYEAANTLGIGKGRQFCAITLPYLRKPMVSVLFAIFTLVITDYGVPLMVGGQYTTLPVILYQDVIGLLDFGKGSVISLVLLFPAIIAFLLDVFNRDKGNLAYEARPFAINRHALRDTLSYILCIFISILVVLPILAFSLLTFATKYPHNLTYTLGNILRALNMNAGQYLWNSILIALLVAVIGTLLAFATGYITARTHGKSGKMLHLITITSLAIPGIVLGLSYILFFGGSFLAGTLWILVLVNLIHFIASPYLMVYNSLSKVNENLEAVGATLGVGRFRIIWNVILPLSKRTLVEMFSYLFVNSMITISAVSFLATVATRPLALMINTFEATMMLECASFVSLLILGVNLLVKGGIGLYTHRLEKKS